MSKEQLFGAHGGWVEHNIKGQQANFICHSDRQATVRKFKKGELAYAETSLGGCAEVKPCEKKAMRSFMSCVSCSKAVIKLSKLKYVIDAQNNLLQQLEPNTMAWKMEKADLEALVSAENLIKLKS